MLAVEVTPRAAIQLAAAATWWAKHRPSAPDAIRIDFQEAIAVLASQPGVGARSSTVRYPGLRRLYLSIVRYHIYYQVLNGRLVVVAFWHASRGSGPGL